VLERGGFGPIPFFYVMGDSLGFLFLTWHIPSVAGSMMAGGVLPERRRHAGRARSQQSRRPSLGTGQCSPSP
jgi:hypothetical protein